MWRILFTLAALFTTALGSGELTAHGFGIGQPLPQSALYMATGPGFRLPQRIFSPADNQRFVVVHKHFCVNNHDRSDFIFALPNYYLQTIVTQPETKPGNTLENSWFFVQTDDGKFVDGIEGDQTAVDGGTMYVHVPATIHANQCGFITACYSVPSGGQMVTQTKNDNPTLGEGNVFSSSCADPSTYKSTGFNWIITNGRAFSPAPALAVARGQPANEHSYELLGDSYCIAQATLAVGARGDYGYVEIGLDDAPSGRKAFLNFCASGTGAFGDMQSGAYKLRTITLQGLPNPPTTDILSEQGHNDSGLNITQYGTTYDGASGYWNLMQSRIFPSMTTLGGKTYQTTISGFVFSSLSDGTCPNTPPGTPPFSSPFPYGYTDTTHQCANSTNFSLPSGSVPAFSAAMIANTYSKVPATRVIDMRGYMFGDPPYPHTWTSSDANADHMAVSNTCGTLAADSLINANHLVVSDPNPFAVNDTLGVAPATATSDFQTGLTVTSMVDSGTATTLTFSENYPSDGGAKAGSAHTAGDTICTIAAGDGVHAVTAAHIIQSGGIIAAKISNGGSILP